MNRQLVRSTGLCLLLLSTLVSLPLLAQDSQTKDALPTVNSAEPTINAVSRSLAADPRVIKVKGINSPDRDNNPIISADGNVIFFNSTRKGSRAWARFKLNNNRWDDDIYYSTRVLMRRDEEVWNEPINLGPLINSSEDDGIAAIAPDGQSAYFSSLKPGWERDGGPFYHVKLAGTEWSDVTGLGGGITEFFRDRNKSGKFRMYGAAISSDGHQFYFATTLKSPSGNHQIWMSEFRDGAWQYPTNLGNTINDGNGCYAPFLASDGKTLFFTRGTGQAGDDDIYVSTFKDGQWQTPVNVGAPINTPGVDAFLSVPASGDRVYLSSSREGDEDIFRTPLPEFLRPTKVVLLGGQVMESSSGEPLEANIVIEDLQSGQKIFNVNSNSATGRYTVVLQPGKDYGISVTAKGHVFLSERYTIPENTEYVEFARDFCIDKIREGRSFVVKNLFFAYNSDSLTTESRPELDRLADFLNEYPKAQIEIGGHTDNVGSAGYNLGLSLRRAESVQRYLVETKGVDVSRIRTRGYGFQKPTAANDSEEGRQQNRRTEFTIITMQ
jgi:outer membrane protein OmpA-like peptidoglycan-associated protein